MVWPVLDSPLDHRIPRLAWAILGLIAAYQAVMYGWVMRVYLHWSVVLIPWLLHQPGYRLYENIYVQHAPGSFWLEAALYTLIPNAELRVRLLMIGITTGAMALVFMLARRWWGLAAGGVGAALYALWGAVIMDHLMYYEFLLGTLALMALAIWHEADQDTWQRPLVAGLFVGFGVLVKQQGLAVIAVFIIWRALARPDWRTTLMDGLRFLAGAAIPVGGVALLFASQGRLDNALFWTWTYNTNPDYVAATRQGIALREIVLVAGWLALTPLFAWFVIPQKNQWKRQGILLLGLLPALLTPAYPRYGRFHLSAGVPIVALIGAGALFYALEAAQRHGDLRRWLYRGYGLAGAGLALIALLLPTYYRVRLGPRTGEYAELIPVATWLREEADAEPGDSLLALPNEDHTNNLFAIGGYLPPAPVTQTYSWFYDDVPGIREELAISLADQPPAYVVVFRRWRNEIPDDLLDFVEAQYHEIGRADFSNDAGPVIFYQYGD